MKCIANKTVVRVVYFDWSGTLARPGTRKRFIKGDASVMYPDTRPLLLHLQKLGYRCGIISNTSNSARAFARALEYHQLPITAAVVCLGPPDGLPWRKPDERAFYAALQQDQVFPHEALMIGDDETDDVFGATRVGMHAVRIDRRKEGLLSLLSRFDIV